MTQSCGPNAARRRTESLVERQARVGIVANPKRLPKKVLVPRDVWTRWPDLRSAKRRSNGAATREPAKPPKVDPLAGFARSVRGARAVKAGHENGLAPITSALGRRVSLLVLSAILICLGSYLVLVALPGG